MDTLTEEVLGLAQRLEALERRVDTETGEDPETRAALEDLQADLRSLADRVDRMEERFARLEAAFRDWANQPPLPAAPGSAPARTADR